MSGTLKEDSFPGKNHKCGLKQIVNSYSFKITVKCENKTPWDARTIDNKHAALSAEKSSDNPFVKCNLDRKVFQVNWLPGTFSDFCQGNKAISTVTAPESFDHGGQEQ